MSGAALRRVTVLREERALPDYEKMYFELFRASEKAIRVLIEAQRACEEAYLSAPEPRLVELPREKTDKQSE